jgi:hypothetical protein
VDFNRGSDAPNEKSRNAVRRPGPHAVNGPLDANSHSFDNFVYSFTLKVTAPEGASIFIEAVPLRTITLLLGPSEIL